MEAAEHDVKTHRPKDARETCHGTGDECSDDGEMPGEHH